MVKKHAVLPQYRRNTATGAYDIRLGKACMTIMSITGISSGPAARSVRRWIPSLALVIAGTVLTVTSTLAAPLAGTVIRAQALASYDLAGSAGPEKVSSNTVIAIIQPVRALALTQDNNLPRPAASTVTFAHVLTNKGNVAENYIFAVDQTGCTTPNLGFQAAPALYVDVNGNGIADPNDRKLTLGASAALSLAPGESADVLLQVQVPLAANGGRSCVRLVATAEAGKWGATPISAQNLDTVLITSNASVVLTKSVNYSGLAVPGSTVLTYTVTANNIGNNDAVPTDTVPTPGSILVDGRPRALVMIRDKVPAGTQYVAGSLQTAVAGALRLFRLASDAPFSYHSEPAPVMGIASGRDDSSAVEVAIGLPVSLPRNASVSMGFRARLLATAGAEIKNTAWSDFNDGASPAESGSNTVTVHATSGALGLSKAASVPVVNIDAHGVVDGTATVRFQLLARNFGTDTLARFALTGKVILDNGGGSGVAHDAVQNGTEPALTDIPLSLTNCAGTVYSATTSAADGSFSLNLTGVPANQVVCMVQTLPGNYTPVSANSGNAPGVVTTTTSRSTTLRFTPAAYTNYSGVVLGNVTVSSLTSDGEQQTTPGYAVTYSHLYTAGSAGSVRFATTDNPSPVGLVWSSVIYRDVNCNGVLDSSDNLLTAPVTVTAGQRMCLLNRVLSPAGAPSGAKDITTLSATETWSVPTLTPGSQSNVMQNTDTTKVGIGGLTLLKEVRKLSANCPVDAKASTDDLTPYALAGSTRPGDSLEYRLTYVNNTAAPVTDIKLNDSVPAFTLFKGALCLSWPKSISDCTVAQQPALDAPSGSIVWVMLDNSTSSVGLQPLDSGTVSFCVKVQQ